MTPPASATPMATDPSSNIQQQQQRPQLPDPRLDEDDILNLYGETNTELPRDARLVALLLRSMGVEDYEPKVLLQLLDFMHRYLSEVIQDASIYSEHAVAPKVRLEDIKLAIETRISHSFTHPPDRHYMAQLAQKKNSQPLPLVPERHGIRLPADKYCLTGVNYQLVPEKRVRTKEPPNFPASIQQQQQLFQQQQSQQQFQQQLLQQPQFAIPAPSALPTAPTFSAPSIPLVPTPAQQQQPAKGDDEDYDMD